MRLASVSTAWPQARASAAQALIAGGEAVLPALQTALNQNGRSVELMSQVARICGRLGGEQAIDLLYKQMTYPDEWARTQILLALSRCGYQAGDDEGRALIQQQIRAEMAQVAWLSGAQVRLGQDEPGEAMALLNTALENNLARHRLRLFMWLSFIHDPASLLRARDILSPAQAGLTQKVSGQQRAYALELLDVMLPAQQKGALLSLVDDLTPAQRLRRLTPDFPQPDLNPNQYLQAIINGSPEWFSPWSRVCALYVVGQLAVVELAGAAISALESPEAVVRQTAVWSLAKLDAALYWDYISPLSQDASSHVVKAIKALEATTEGEKMMLMLVEKVIYLKAVDFLSETPEAVLAGIAAILEEIEVKAGETILAKGETNQAMYIIVEGQAQWQSGQRPQSVLNAGDVFGELSILNPDPQPAAMMAKSDTHLLRLDQEPFFELLEDQPRVARRMMQRLAQRLQRSQGDSSSTRARDDLLGGLKEKLARPV